MTVTEWDRREVCPDGACIGVIGDDGLCKVCGRAAPNWGNDRLRGLAENPESPDTDDEDDDDDEDEGDDELAAAEDAAANDEASDADWDRRELCSNGACVGVIADDGICSVCRSPRA